MPDPRRNTISTGALSIRPADAPEKWAVRGPVDRAIDADADGDQHGPVVEAHWGEWVRLARRILDADALSRDLESRGDAWDQGHAAGGAAGASGTAGDEAVNPYR